MRGRNEVGHFFNLFIIVLAPSLSASGQYAQIVLSQVTWPALGGATNDTVGGAAIYLAGTSDADGKLVAFLDLDNSETNGNNFILVPASGGNIILSS